jgi:hypothetical protein
MRTLAPLLALPLLALPLLALLLLTGCFWTGLKWQNLDVGMEPLNVLYDTTCFTPEGAPPVYVTGPQ